MYDQGLPCSLSWQHFCEFQPWKPRTVQTQTRLLLKKQSDQVLHCLLFDSIFANFSSENQQFIEELVFCQTSLEKQCRPRSDCFWWSNLIKIFTVCYYDSIFVNSSPENYYFIWEQKEKGVWNFRKFTIAHDIMIVFYIVQSYIPFIHCWGW